MTPKEKAKELINKNIELLKINNLQDWALSTKYAKQSSLLSVEFSREFITGNLSESFDKTMYLFEVKQEIEKL
jgi:hypothetical protein